MRLSLLSVAVVLAQDDSSGEVGGILQLLVTVAIVGGIVALLSAVRRATKSEDPPDKRTRPSSQRRPEIQPGMRAIARDGRDLGTITKVISTIVEVEGAVDEDDTPITRVFRSDLDLPATTRDLNPDPIGKSVANDLRIDTGDWSTDHLREIRNRLDERGIAHELTDGHLTASASAHSAVRTIVDEVLRTTEKAGAQKPVAKKQPVGASTNVPPRTSFGGGPQGIGTLQWIGMTVCVAVVGGVLMSNGERTTVSEIGLPETGYTSTGIFGMSLLCVAAAMFFGRGTFRSLGNVVRGEGRFLDVIFAGSNVMSALITLAASAGAVILLGVALTG